MVRTPCNYKGDVNKGAWTAEEDTILRNYIRTHGETGWRSLPKKAGLNRCGKSCRLRWLNYLRPDIKRGNISPDEEELIIRMHRLLGNRWSLIAGRLPGRTDNEIKNYWNTHLSKKLLTVQSAGHSKAKMAERTASWQQDHCKERSFSSNSSEDEMGHSDHSETGSVRDKEVNSTVLEGIKSSDSQEVLDVSKSWSQFLEDTLTANPVDDLFGVNDDWSFKPSFLEARPQVEPPNDFCSTSSNDLAVPELSQPDYLLTELNSDQSISSQLDASYPLDYSPFYFPCTEFGLIQDVSVDSLLHPTPCNLEDVCPVQSCDNVDHGTCFSIEVEKGMAEICNSALQEPDLMQQRKCQSNKRLGDMGLDELEHLCDHEENWEDQGVVSLIKDHEDEEYITFL